MTAIFDELGGAVLITDRRGHRELVETLVEGCRCVNGEFLASDGTEQGSALELMAYLFANLDVEGYLGWSCDRGYLALVFEDDGALIVVWSGQAVTLAIAIEVVEEIARVVLGDQGYVILGGWVPLSNEEFVVGFEGETLHRFSRKQGHSDESL